MKARSVNPHSKHTDNASLHKKVFLRKKATENLDELNVLDCFAGKNKIWKQIPHNRYFGIEKETGKGDNLWVDNRRVLIDLDLSRYNVIDLDSYGMPIKQIEAIFKNGSAKPGTVVIYTAIGSAMSALNKELVNTVGIGKMYKKVKTMFNARGGELFHGYLYSKGIRRVWYYKTQAEMSKEYGYFVL